MDPFESLVKLKESLSVKCIEVYKLKYINTDKFYVFRTVH